MSLVPFSEVAPDVAAPFSGLWVKAPRLDCIVYDDKAPQRHAVFHEVAHMLLGHLSTEDLDGLQLRLMSALLPDLPPQVIKRTVRAGLCRWQYYRTYVDLYPLWPVGRRHGVRRPPHRPQASRPGARGFRAGPEPLGQHPGGP